MSSSLYMSFFSFAYPVKLVLLIDEEEEEED
jgi:hypothetical protein